MSVRELRDELGRRIDAAHFLSQATVVTKNGEPRAALVPMGVFDAIISGQQSSPGAPHFREEREGLNS